MKHGKHTPGPWIVREWKRKHRTNKGELQFRYKYEVSDANGSAIECSTSNEANAQLIAAAPEMYELLVDIACTNNGFAEHAKKLVRKVKGGAE